MREWLSYHLGKLSARLAPAQTVPNLSGDRQIEWPFVMTRLGRLAKDGSRVLDFGTGVGMLASAGAIAGAQTVSVDLYRPHPLLVHSRLSFCETDIMQLGGQAYDVILNCSVIEHVGLGVRYDLEHDDGKDLKAMAHLRSLLADGGVMILTLPVGRDAVFAPHHRVYGQRRLPQLLEGYVEKEAVFFRKNPENQWIECDRSAALAEAGGPRYYALGCFVLGLKTGDA